MCFGRLCLLHGTGGLGLEAFQGRGHFAAEGLDRPHGGLVRHLTGLRSQQQRPDAKAILEAQLSDHRIWAANDQVAGGVELGIRESQPHGGKFFCLRFGECCVGHVGEVVDVHLKTSLSQRQQDTHNDRAEC
jgi:hypothetical protein